MSGTRHTAMDSRMKGLHPASEHLRRLGNVRDIPASISVFIKPWRLSFNILNGDACFPDLLRSTTRAQQTDAGAVKTRCEVKEVGLVVDRQQGFQAHA